MMKVFLRWGAFSSISRSWRSICLPGVASGPRERRTHGATGGASFSCLERQDFSLVSPTVCSRNTLHTQVNLLATGPPRELDDRMFDKLSNETLDELAEFFEDLGDSGLCSTDYDVTLASGVLTITIGGGHGTYVINKQSVNKQIWFSSPKSGPKRYDVIDGRWRYSHSGEALHDLLQREFSEILGTDLDLSQMKYSHLISDADNWAN